MNYWLVKSEPFKFSWDYFVSKGGDHWDGVRNYQARNNLMGMKKDDLVLFYHSNEGLEIVGIAKVKTEHYPDPTTDDPRWVVVDLVPESRLPKPVSLKVIKEDHILNTMPLVKHSRLSVMPVQKYEFDRVIQLAYE